MDKSNWTKPEFRWLDLLYVVIGVAVCVGLIIFFKGVYS